MPSSTPRCLLWALLVGLVLTGGCDSVPSSSTDERRSPRVSNLQIVTDSIRVMEEDSLAEVVLGVAVQAVDPDGRIAQVISILEPASNPRGAASVELQSSEGAIYARRIGLTVPLAEEIFTIRTFAVDDDSLTSNQVTGQFRFDPDDETRISRIGSRTGGMRNQFVPSAARLPLSIVSGHQRPQL